MAFAHDLIVADDVLAYLNAVMDPYELRDRIQDDPNMGAAKPTGMPLKVASNILAARDALGRDFKTLAEIDAAPGVGRDVMHNILYSFRPRTEAASLYRSFQSFIELNATARPAVGDSIHVGEAIELEVTLRNVAPVADRSNGIPEVTFSDTQVTVFPTGFTSEPGPDGFKLWPFSSGGPWQYVALGSGGSHTQTISADFFRLDCGFLTLTATAVNDGVSAPIFTVVAGILIQGGTIDPPWCRQDLTASRSFLRIDRPFDVYAPILPT